MPETQKTAYKNKGEKKLPISAFIIALNEEQNIRQCLESVSFCEEIIVVDSGSIDRTKLIALEFGAKVIEHPFKGYRDQKQFALEQCVNEWVLSIDADERVEQKLYEFIAQLDLTNNLIDGYEVKRLYWFLGRWMKHSGLYPDYKLRFFRKLKGKFVGANIHEVVKVEGKVEKIDFDLLHYSWVDTKDFFIRQIKYAEKVAENKFLEGKTTSFFEVVSKLKFTFFNKFFLRLGFLDQMPGFIVSFGLAIATAYKYLKLWELNNKLKSKSFFQHNIFAKILLKPVQLFYGLAAKTRIRFYQSGVLKQKNLDMPVISIGNLSVGGSGKTPFVIWLTKLLAKQSINNVAILSRGYKAKFERTSTPKEVALTSSPLEVGDEPLLMKQALVEENTNVLIHPSRFLSGKYATENLGSELLILDDGFQHMQLKRDLNICLIDCSDPYFSELFPIGSRRESLDQLRRADVFVLTRGKSNSILKQKYIQYIQKYSNKKIFELNEGISKFTVGLTPIEEYPKGKKVLAFCGLGNPSQFFQELENYGVKIQKTISYPDHHNYETEDLEYLQRQLKNSESEYLITTAKDAVKICNDEKQIPNLLVAHHQIHSLSLLEGDFQETEIEKNAFEDSIHSQLVNLLGLEIIEKLTNKEAHKIG